MVSAGINWHALLVPSVSLVELSRRGSVRYLLILGLMREFRREAGSRSIPDLLSSSCSWPTPRKTGGTPVS